MTARTQPYPPPFAVGTRVRYHGFDHRRGGDDVPWVRDGDVGVVIRTRVGSPGYPHLSAELAEPNDGWSVVQFHDHPDAIEAVDRSSTRPRDGRGSWFERLAK